MISDNNRENIINMRKRTKRLERENRYWNKDEKWKLRTMFYDGIGISEISLVLQRSEMAVIQQIEKEDLFERKSRPQRKRQHMRRCSACLCNSCNADASQCPRNICINELEGVTENA